MQIEDAKVGGLVANTQLQDLFIEWSSSCQIMMIQLERAASIQPFITITGDNLLFLREPVKMNEMEWETIVQEDQKIIALEPSSSNILTETISFVVVNMAFGKCSKIIMEVT
jgi:hypothetical protein